MLCSLKILYREVLSLKKEIGIFAAAAALMVSASAAALMILNRQDVIPVREVPKFVLPESEQQTSAEITAKTEECTAPSSESTTEQLPDNVMMTSCDPEHYIRFEFRQNKLLFSGVYSGNAINEIKIGNNLICNDLSHRGSSFSGSISLFGLDEGYYNIRVSTENHGSMSYVFEITPQGAQPLPTDKLPSESNLSVTKAPLEIPADTVLKLITASGEPERAADVLAQIREISDVVCKGLDNDLDKARALAEWVSENIYYDFDARENGVSDESLTLEAILENHRSVCYGWTNLYSALCQAQGIDCLNINGSIVAGSRCFLQAAQSEERAHSWNMLIINGEEFWVDTVWNSSNTYQEGKYSKGSTDLQYFGITNEILAHDHRAARCERRDYFEAIE